MPEITLPQFGSPTDRPDAAAQPAADSPGVAPGDGMRVYLETFGCQMNELDSELVHGRLDDLGYTFTDRWQDADVVLYNTCSVREQAENKALSRVGVVGRHKQALRPDLVLGVIGCLAQRDGTDLLKRHPQVDLLCSPAELHRLPELVTQARQQAQPRERWEPQDVPAWHEKPFALDGAEGRKAGRGYAAGEDVTDELERLDLARGHVPGAGAERKAAGSSAYVRITRGCNKKCTYCVVPNTRGPEVHRHPDHIVDECKRLADAGAIEVTLLGQTVNHYHYDVATARQKDGYWQPQVGTVLTPNRGNGGPSPVFNATTTSFAQLLARIHDEVPAIARLRFVTNYPRDFGDDILDVIAQRPRICRYLHLPVQSGSDRVLARMNRGYRIDQYKALLDRVHHRLPGVTLATDIIVGFPGETDDDHAATAALLREARFKNSFIFKYSPRPGTPAYDRVADDIPDEVKRQRNQELLAIQHEVSTEVHASYVGQTVEVLVEGPSPRGEDDDGQPQLIGRTAGDLIVHFAGHYELAGTLQTVKITGSQALALSGTLRAP